MSRLTNTRNGLSLHQVMRLRLYLSGFGVVEAHGGLCLVYACICEGLVV